jgi:hypothetical protein
MNSNIGRPGQGGTGTNTWVSWAGTLFSSSMFPDRAPAGQVVFTTFIGGSRNRALAAAPLYVATIFLLCPFESPSLT